MAPSSPPRRRTTSTRTHSPGRTQAATTRASTLQQQLAESQRREKELGTRVASLQSRVESQIGSAEPSLSVQMSDAATTQLQDDLAGARRCEDTLRKENGILQKELAQAQAASKMLGEKLAALQVGMGQSVPPVPPLPPTRPARAKVSRNADEDGRSVRQLKALKAEELPRTLHAIEFEEAGDIASTVGFA